MIADYLKHSARCCYQTAIEYLPNSKYALNKIAQNTEWEYINNFFGCTLLLSL